MKDLETVEFADFQCPHCKDAQANMESWRWTFRRRGLSSRAILWSGFIPQAKTAAAYGVCVAKLGGNDAFFSFASAVFDGQEGLATPMAPL